VLECTNAYTPSPQALSSCSGGVIDYALEMIMNTGEPTESSYPYAAGNFGSGASFPSTIGSCGNTANYELLTFAANKSRGLWYRYNNLSSSSISSLLNSGSMVVAIYVENSFYSYSSGVYSCSANFDTAYTNINHAVELVGMDCSGNYIVKNSWGTSWGQGGFAYVSPTSDCAISAYVYSVLWGLNLQLPLLTLLLSLALLI
jgi:hypothetical protein